MVVVLTVGRQALTAGVGTHGCVLEPLWALLRVGGTELKVGDAGPQFLSGDHSPWAL